MVGAGIIMDGALGIRMLRGIAWEGILLHLLVILVWFTGLQLCTKHAWQATWKMQRWGVIVLLSAFCVFPGLGIGMYSSALCFAPEMWKKRERAQGETEKVPIPSLEVLQEISPTFDFDVQPFIETSHDANIDISRAAIAILNQSELLEQTHPPQTLPANLLEATDFLQVSSPDPLEEISSCPTLPLDQREEISSCPTLPLDQREEISSLPTLPLDWQNEALQDEALRDAPNTYTFVDDEQVQDLPNDSLSRAHDPGNKALALDLVEQYYHAAHSDTLDKQSRKAYLEQTRGLLWHLLWNDNQNASLWIKLAQTRYELGSFTDALKDALYALELQPHMLDYAILAMSLAFRLHAWDTLVQLVQDKVAYEELPVSLQLLKWWSMLPAEKT